VRAKIVDKTVTVHGGCETSRFRTLLHHRYLDTAPGQLAGSTEASQPGA